MPASIRPISLGVDLGGTAVKIAAIDSKGSATIGRSDPYARPSADALASAIAAAAEGIDRSRVVAIGVCAPGVFDASTGRIVRSLNLPALEGLDLAQFVRGSLRLACPVEVVSDAHAAAHDVARQERLQGRLLAISIGTGVGAAVLDDGALLLVSAPGRGRSSGHLGQLDVRGDDPDPPLASDGSRGTLESYIGLPALRKRYAVADDQLCRVLVGGDEASTPVGLAPPLRALARAIRISHAIYRPDHVRLLGGIGIRLGPVVDGLRTVIDDGLTSLAMPGWTLATGTSDAHAARGAAVITSDKQGS